MGNGRRDGDRLNFQATADFAMTPNDAFRWRCAFTKASELLFNATEGQLRFGRIFVTTDGLAIDDADYELTDVGDRAFATFGDFGEPGRSLTLPPLESTRRGDVMPMWAGAGVDQRLGWASPAWSCHT